eukprot:TRINITY_DN9305_c0_g1_i1.p4 TRINITY_DN9305_c0_g1~~TRINITY_DN9305_c0_g1_i1.p4  ORF type:complete len:176 (+),score=28.42 TRINITY_DN9305_c0_g1_i1:2121-2648(+)
MEVELAVLNAQTKAELQPRVRKYRADYDNVRRQFMRLQEKYIQQKDKETLMGAQMEDPTGVHHNKLLNHQDMVMKQNFALEGAIRTGYEAGSVALDIERDLRDQNVRAVGSQGKLKNMQGMLGESDSIITRMLRREKLTKLALAGICAILVLALLIILYYKLFKQLFNSFYELFY